MNKHALISEKKSPVSEKEANKPPPLQLPAAPINVLDNGLAQTYTHIHPFAILAVFFARFQSLVADPTSTLLNGLAPLGILQIVYVVLCLPPTTNSTASPKTPQKPARSKKPQSGKNESSAAGRTVVRLCQPGPPPQGHTNIVHSLLCYPTSSQPSSQHLYSPSSSSYSAHR